MNLASLYVDVENLRDIAQQVIVQAVKDWPIEFPKPNTMHLYVSADQTHLWELWASHQFPLIKISVHGVQRYSSVTKNSADISLVLNALADLLKGRSTHVAILSDDSDYIALFKAINTEIPRDQRNLLPFLWFITDRSDTHSRSLKTFIPPLYFHIIASQEDNKPKLENPQDKIPLRNRQITSDKMKVNSGNREPEMEKIAIAILQDIAVGPFRSTDCMKIVKKQFPGNQLSNTDNAAFGNQFAKNIWPILEKHGVRLPNPDKKPRKYEMTEEAKKSK